MKTDMIKAQLLMAIVADEFGVTVDELKGGDRRANTVIARRILVYLCRDHLHMFYREIEDLVNKDFCALMSSYKYIEKCLKDEDPKYDGLRSIVLTLVERLDKVWAKVE